MPNQKIEGMSITSVVIALLLTSGAITAFFSYDFSTKKGLEKDRMAVAAQFSASELLELFRAHSQAQLKAYLTLNGYPLCSKVNYLDRANSSPIVAYLQTDSLASLPLNPPKAPFLSTGASQANRFYQVSVVNFATLAENAAACGQSPAYSLASTERYLVTVSVSYLTDGDELGSPRQVSLSTLIL